ncbi:hypothetical protein MMC16_006420 [Acarospora aff. strigata]|nr:hypothetical protein [Acarospora aff. strigata]
MLGKLLHTAASSLSPNVSSARSHTSLHSVTEEAHTYNLLFPDADLLRQSQNYVSPLHTTSSSTAAGAAGRFDDQGDWDIQSSQDIRIIIAQDAIGALDQPTVLYDSRPPPARPPPPKSVIIEPKVGGINGQGLPLAAQSTRSGPTIVPLVDTHHHGMQKNSAQLRSPLAPKSESSAERPAHVTPQGAEGAMLRSSLRGKSGTSALNGYESIQSRLASEAEDEQKSLVNCMFGVTAFSYKGPSTKLHILPFDNGSEGSSRSINPALDRGYGSMGRGEGPRRSQLVRPVTASSSRLDRRPPSPSISNPGNRKNESNTVLVTRMFSVNLPQTGSPSGPRIDTTSPVQDRPSSAPEYPFPQGSGSEHLKAKKAKQIKTPMYGIAIILQLPNIHRRAAAPPSRSENRCDWLTHGSESFTMIAGVPSETDGRLDHIVRHWDVITRTLSYLQAIAIERILALLKVEREASPALAVPVVESEPTAPGKEPLPAKKPKLQGTNQRSLRLRANALMGNADIHRNAKLAGVRIALGLKIPRVVTGQGRWGVWREEARWVGKWAGGKEQNFFFFNLLTSFLGNHTGWLNSLGPRWYKRRHLQQQLAQQSEPVAISSRTVIVSPDKIAARRMIFLLSTFLAAKNIPTGSSSPQRPDTSASCRSYSQSPPSGIPLLRQESLRRTINKRGRGNRSGSGDHRNHQTDTSFPSHDMTRQVSEIDQPSVQPGRHSRRQSASRSINAMGLPISSSGTTTRKNSTTTTATATPSRTVPIPHFASHESEGQRPVSSESIASVTLRHTLNRSESINLSNDSADSQPASRWGSVMSGFWSNRRESSTDESDLMALSQEGLGISGLHGPGNIVAQSPQKSKLAKMADEASRYGADGELYAEDLEDTNIRSSSTMQASPDQAQDLSKDPSPTAAKAIPERPKLCASPLKMSVDENDGVVDVDLPVPRTLSSSFGSHRSSPSKAHHTSWSSLDGYGSGCSTSRAEPESTANVAGWLKRYHEDFALQAVQPYADLVNDIKRSMKAEPTPNTTTATPHGEGGPVDKWVDVCTTLIADASTFSITRLRLRRKVRLYPLPHTVTHSEVRPCTPPQPQYGNPYTAAQLTPGFGTLTDYLEEDMMEESVMDIDGIFIDAVERVLAQSGQSSKVHSNASSRSSSTRGRQDQGGPDALPTLEVPRGDCKKLVLGALEQVVKSVTADRALEEHGGRGRDIGVGPSRTASMNSNPAESSLREGIRKWLLEVEEA